MAESQQWTNKEDMSQHRTMDQERVMGQPVKWHLSEPDIEDARESSTGSDHQHFLIRLSISKIAPL